MEELLKKIELLKEKILVAIESFNFYNEVKYIKETLFMKLNSYEYDPNDEMELKKYYAWLQDFYEGRIEAINNIIAANDNNSVFDNSTEEQYKEIDKQKEEIEKLLEYIKENYPEFAESIKASYEKINSYYEEEYKTILENVKKKFNIDLGLSKEPTLSLYPDINTLIRSYITKLENFNKSCSNIKTFTEKDTKIKETFKKAYETLTEQNVIEMIKQMEANYKQAIDICIKNNFYLEGIERVQDDALSKCAQLEELIQKEITKKDYCDQILNMTLNIDPDKLMDIINYVETNNLFREELLNNLYVLVEQEKYLLKKYNSKPKIYDSLNEKIKIELEKMFISRLSEKGSEETTQIIDKLKKYGYINVPDQEYYNFFSNQSYTNEIELDVEEPKYSIFNYIYKEYYTGDLYYHKEKRWRFNLLISNRKDLPLVDHNSPLYKSDIFISKNNMQSFAETHDYVFLRYGREDIKKLIINLNTGKATKPKKSIAEQLFNYLVGYNSKDKKMYVYNSNHELIHTFERFEEVLADYRKGLILITNDDDYKISIYNKDFNYIKTLDIPIEYYYSISVNDGVLTLSGPNREIIYFDYINMKVIDSFKHPQRELFENIRSQYVYSEGLYTFVGKNGYKGYKDLEGNIVIEPKYKYALPFMGNIAVVSIEEQKGIIDRTGTFRKKEDIYKELINKKYELYKTETMNPLKLKIDGSFEYLSISRWDTIPAYMRPDYMENRYQFLFERTYSGRNKGHLLTTDHYKISLDKPIMNIDFVSESKSIVLKPNNNK